MNVFGSHVSEFKKRYMMGKIDHVLFENESMIRDDQAIQKKRGFFGRIVWQEDEHCTAETFLTF